MSFKFNRFRVKKRILKHVKEEYQTLFCEIGHYFAPIDGGFMFSSSIQCPTRFLNSFTYLKGIGHVFCTFEQKVLYKMRYTSNIVLFVSRTNLNTETNRGRSRMGHEISDYAESIY